MASLKLTDLTKATRLLDRLVAKADLNGDGAIRAGDVDRIRNQPGVGRITRGSGNETQMLTVALDTFRRSAASQGGPTLDNIRAVLGETKEKLRARDTNGDGVIVDTERRSTMTAAEKSLMSFAEVCKNLKVSDFKIPKATEWQAPPFSWSGTPAKVAQSLLDHCSNPANDNRWPSWGTPRDNPARASRYVVDTAEAKAMVEALKPLYVSRQKAVLTEIAKRTDSRDYGCVSPTDAGKRVLQAFARELGVTLTFKQPAAPAMPNP